MNGVDSPFDNPENESKISYSEDKEIHVLSKPPYEVGVVACESGSEVFTKYKEQPCKERELWLIAEKVSKQNEFNFFGTFCLVKFGEEYRTLLNDRIIPRSISVKASIQKSPVGTIQNFAEHTAYLQKVYKKYFSDAELETELIENAVNLELKHTTSVNRILSIAFGWDEFIADGCYFLADKIDKIKFKSENYNYVPGKEFKPLLPISFIVNPDSSDENKQEVKDITSFLLQQLDEVTVGAQNELKKLLSKSEFVLPPVVRTLYNKLKSYITDLKQVVSSVSEAVKNFTVEYLLLANAYWCGFINGLLSIIQALLFLIGFVVDYFAGMDKDKLVTGEGYMMLRNVEEHAEDILQFFDTEFVNIKSAAYDFIVKFEADKFKEIFSVIENWWDRKTSYELAYYAGAFIFEVVVGVLLALLTAGSSAAAQGATKARQLLKLVWDEVLSTLTFGLKDLLKLLSQFFKNLAIALADSFTKGVEEIKNLLKKIFGIQDEAKVADEVADFALSEGSKTTKAKVLSKAYDKTLLAAKRVEQEIQHFDVEHGMIFDRNGNPIFDEFVIGTEDSIKFDNISQVKTDGGILVHNHPKNGALSYHDITTFVEGLFKEVRAIGKNGEIYSLIRKGELPNVKQYTMAKYKIMEDIRAEFPELKANNEILKEQEIFADRLIEFLGKSVEYRHYK
ncbi:MAG: hypothetical protein POELPBGB_01327 [Bacteroidia bacterium]|nr:hypothetical protein [Bacteroidia bacterium]